MLGQSCDSVVRCAGQPEVEKLLVNVAGTVPSLWIQRQNWWSEALHGVQSGCAAAAATGPLTGGSGLRSFCPVSFPAAISTAASFNKSLFHAVGTAIGTEARALSNVGAADGWTFWSRACRAVLYTSVGLLVSSCGGWVVCLADTYPLGDRGCRSQHQRGERPGTTVLCACSGLWLRAAAAAALRGWLLTAWRLLPAGRMMSTSALGPRAGAPRRVLVPLPWRERERERVAVLMARPGH